MNLLSFAQTNWPKYLTLFFQKLNKDSLWKRFSALFQLVASTEYSLPKPVWCFLVLRLFKFWCASEEVRAWARRKESVRVGHVPFRYWIQDCLRSKSPSLCPCSANLLHDPSGMEANSPFHRGGTWGWFCSTGCWWLTESWTSSPTADRSTILKFSTLPVFSVAALGFVSDESSQQRSGCP